MGCRWGRRLEEEGGEGGQVLFLVPVTCSLVVAKLSEQRRNETNLHPYNGSHLNRHFNQRSEDYFQIKKNEKEGGKKTAATEISI